jgi:hypothetical protein
MPLFYCQFLSRYYLFLFLSFFGIFGLAKGSWGEVTNVVDNKGMIGAHPTEPISGTLYRCTSTNTWTAYYNHTPILIR